MTTRQNYAPRAARPFGALNDCNAAQQFFKISVARLALRFSDRAFRSAAVVSQIHQRRNNIRFDSGRRRGRRFLRFHAKLPVCPSTRPHALRRLPPHAGNSRQPRQVAPANRRHEFLDAHPAQDFQCERRTHAGSRKRISKKCFSREDTNPYKASASSRTCVWIRRVTSVRSSRARRKSKAALERHSRLRPRRQALGLVFFGKPSAKLANHRSPVLPLFFRPSTRSRASAAVFANELCLGKTCLSSRAQHRPSSRGFQTQLRIERIQLEEIPCGFPGGGHGPHNQFCEIVAAWRAPLGSCSCFATPPKVLGCLLEDRRGTQWTQVPPGVGSSMMSAMLCVFCRRIIPFQLRGRVRSVAREFSRDRFTSGKAALEICRDMVPPFSWAKTFRKGEADANKEVEQNAIFLCADIS